MKPANLPRKFIWILCSLAVFIILAGADWFPTLKSISRLKRGQRDATLRAKNVAALASAFVFPDAGEKRLLAESEVRLLQALPASTDDRAWLAETASWLRAQAGRDAIDGAQLVTAGLPGGALVVTPLLAEGGMPAGIGARSAVLLPDIGKRFEAATDPERFPWQALFSSRDLAAGQLLACRPLAVFVSAPLPALLNFVNHCSWSNSRLEVIGLRLETWNSRLLVLLVCRGIYRVRAPSPWQIRRDDGKAAASPLIDSDSPLLWQPVDPAAAGPAEKNELASFDRTGD